MHKMKFWSLVLVLALAVFAFSGCGGSGGGGGGDSSSESDQDTSIPNSLPDTYDTAQLLTGSWEYVGESAQSVSVNHGENTTLNMTMTVASLVISNVDIDSTSGTMNMTLHETWRAYLNGDTTSYYGMIPINMDDQLVSMTKLGQNNWRLDVYEPYRSRITLEIRAADTMVLTESRVVDIEGAQAQQYENTMTFRKN